MSTTPSEETSEPPRIDIPNGIRYLFLHAIRDFNDAWSLARKRRKNEISSDEFSAAVDRRFPPSGTPRPIP